MRDKCQKGLIVHPKTNNDLLSQLDVFVQRLRFNVIVENPPVICVTPEHNVSFTISLPRKVVLESSEREAFATEVVTHQVRGKNFDMKSFQHQLLHFKCPSGIPFSIFLSACHKNNFIYVCIKS